MSKQAHKPKTKQTQHALGKLQESKKATAKLHADALEHNKALKHKQDNTPAPSEAPNDESYSSSSRPADTSEESWARDEENSEGQNVARPRVAGKTKYTRKDAPAPSPLNAFTNPMEAFSAQAPANMDQLMAPWMEVQKTLLQMSMRSWGRFMSSFPLYRNMSTGFTAPDAGEATKRKQGHA